MRHPRILLIVLLVLAAGYAVKLTLEKRGTEMATFVITETGKFSSLDPLDGDSSLNLPVARMLYATPVEIFADNTLGSQVLESFEYDRAEKTIRWVVREGITFSDGTKITPEDIVFAVARMAFTRPGFPLIKLIAGIQDWIKSPSPLRSVPEGIKVNGNKISIRLTEDYPHPLFRFCLELFSIIPKKCVNLETNKIECKEIPTSGYYELKDNSEKSLVFKKRPQIQKIQGKDYPAEIRFLYRDADKAFSDNSLKNDSTVILSSESNLSREKMKQVQSEFEVGFTPAAWFTILQINPEIAPFNEPQCRFEFAKAFRENFEKLSNETTEASVFTKMIAGYKSYDDLQKKVAPHRRNCSDKFQNAVIPWGVEKSTPKVFNDAILMTAKDLGLDIQGPAEFKDRKEDVENFISNKSAFMYARTGFWALDPTGDIQMLFTPNLHIGLRHFWKDEKLQSELQSIVKNGEVSMKAVDSINTHLFEDAKFNVYSHIRRFYASKNQDLVRHLPIGITSPSPWHLFGER